MSWTFFASLQPTFGTSNFSKYMVISRKRQPIVPLTPILVCANVLERVNSFKYLGVWITKDLTWSSHVNEICTKARRVVGLIYRQYYQYSTPETLNQLYVSFVRPHLEYAAPIWDPHLQKDIDKLEKVQKFALRMCTKNWMAGYDDLLTCCNIPSLKTRHLYLKLGLFCISWLMTSLYTPVMGSHIVTCL